MQARMQTCDFAAGTTAGTVLQDAVLYVVQTANPWGTYGDVDSFDDVNEAKMRAAEYRRTASVVEEGVSYPARTVRRQVTDTIA